MKTILPLSAVAAALWLLAAPVWALEGEAPVVLAAAATPVAAPVVAHPDQPLLDALLATLAAPPGKRGAAAGQLAALHDPRAIAALRYAAMHDRHPELVDAFVALLGRFADPAAVAALSDIARGDETGKPHAGALTALSRHPLTAGADALYAIACDADLDQSIRQDAMVELARAHPQLLAQRGSPVLGGSALVAMAGGGYFGGFALASVGGFAGTQDASVIGWVAGSIVGAGTGYIFGRHIPNERQHYYISALGWGAFAGTIAANAIVARPFDANTQAKLDPEASGLRRTEAALSLLGEVGGFGLAYYAADSLRLSSADVFTTDIIGLATTVATLGGLRLLTPVDDDRPGYATLLAGSLIGVGVGVAIAPRLHFDTGDASLALYGTAEGMYYGGFLGELLLPARPGEAGMMLGGGLGLLLAGGIAQYTAFRPGNVGEMLLFSSYGKALGAGLMLLGNAPSDTVNAVHLGFGLAGVAAATLLADQTTYASGDNAIVPIGTVLGVWHGAFIGVIARSRGWLSGGEQIAGLTLTTASLFGVGSVAMAQSSNFTNMQAAMGSTGAVWGAWFAGWALALDDSAVTDTRAATQLLVGTDVGLAATVLLLSPVADVDPRVLAGANFGGMAGAGLAALFTAMFSDNSKSIVRANLAGSAVGLLAGGLIARAALLGEKPTPGGKAGASLPAWLRLPVKSVSAGPHMDAGGRFDGVVVQAALDVF